MNYRKKLIEVGLPLAAINAAAAREKSIRHGHPSTLHLWWARRPLAACRAVLFAQLVDDPGSLPEEFPTGEEQEQERQRLFEVVKNLVLWENSNDPHVLAAARREIARSVARALGEDAPEAPAAVDAFLAEKAPPVVDPFCGGGSIPLEAQRLGLRATGSDLNPVAVLITKALVEIPPRFAGGTPVNPKARATLAGRDGAMQYRGAHGLAEDVRHYGLWMRDEAAKRIGHLYPQAQLSDGSQATVIAWLWARTVASPNPAAGGAHVPLVSSFVLSSKKGKEAIVAPVVEQGRYRFTVKSGDVSREEMAQARGGRTVGRRGGRCLLTETPMTLNHIRAEGQAGRMGARLLAVVAEGKRGRVYLEPTEAMEDAAREATPHWKPATDLPAQALGFRVQQYGKTRHEHLFTDRQLVALGTFSDLVGEVREKALADAQAAGMDADTTCLADGGSGAEAYADSVATYLGLSVSRQVNRLSSLSFWHSSGAKVEQVFARQALAMVWDFCEANPFSDSSGSFVGQVKYLARVVEAAPMSKAQSAVLQLNVAEEKLFVTRAVVSTDPPYYDNIGYADLSDFFYVWLRHSLSAIYPDLFRTTLTPKTGELVASPYRFGGNRKEARRFFETGFEQATRNIHSAQATDYPMTLFYAYKQAETQSDTSGNGTTASTGWETMLSGIVSSGFTITATWPVRTETTVNLKKNVNALASSIVLACRPRPADAVPATRRDFIAALRRELPAAIRQLQSQNIAPVDLAQAAIGPGMAVFTRYAQVLGADGDKMAVRQALVEINRVLDEIMAAAEGSLDPETRFCVAWFEQHGLAERAYGEAEVLFTAKNTSFAALEKAGVVVGGAGKLRLKRRDELEPHWDPSRDRRIVDWECVQYLVRTMDRETGGGVQEAARLAMAMGAARAENARALAYRLYTAAERKGWAEEALACNSLVIEWPNIKEAMGKLAKEAKAAQGTLLDTNPPPP